MNGFEDCVLTSERFLKTSLARTRTHRLPNATAVSLQNATYLHPNSSVSVIHDTT